MSSPDAIQPAPGAPQAAPDGAVAPAEASAPPPAPDNSRLLGRIAMLDVVMAVLALAFAFLATATVVSNADVLLHLATGRLIAQGQFSYADPFCFTTEGWWVNQAWLFDLLLYSFHAATSQSGAALSALKALGFTAAAWLAFRAASRPGGRLWVPAVCTALGVLAASAHAWLGTVMVSTLFVAALMLLFARHQPGSRWIWAAPALCLLWANTSPWFFLGPLLALLFLAGKAVQSAQAQGDEQAEARAELPQLAALFGACLVACLVNPYFFWAFTAPPAELYRFGSGAVLSDDPLFRPLWASPVEAAYFRADFGLSVAGLSLFLLAALGLASFLVDLGRIQWWRALSFILALALALLSCAAIPLFAVVCAVVMSLNFQEAGARFFGEEAYLQPGWRAWAGSGRLLTCVALFALCVLSLPGWLQAGPQHRRCLAFGLELDEGLVDTARKAGSWREQGLLPEGCRWFNISPEAACYFAWFCPGQKLFIDYRVQAFSDEVAGDYVAVRKALAAAPSPAGQDQKAWLKARNAWKPILAKHQTRMLVFHHFDLLMARNTLARLYRVDAVPAGTGFSIGGEWAACHISGKASAFAWTPRGKAPEGLPPLDEGLVLSFEKLAFGPDAAQAPASPGQGDDRPWYRALLEGDLPSPPEADTARQLALRFDGLKGGYAFTILWYRECRVAAALGGPGVPALALPGAEAGRRWPASAVAWDRALAPETNPGFRDLLARNAAGPPPRDDAPFEKFFDRGPPSALYLSVRAARRALARKPDDLKALLALSAAYSGLHFQTREQLFPHLGEARLGQITAPLHAVLGGAAPPIQRREAHGRLAFVYKNVGYFDLAASHQKEFVRLLEEFPEGTEGTEEEVAKGLKGLNAELQQLEQIVQAAQSRFEREYSHKSLAEKAFRAWMGIEFRAGPGQVARVKLVGKAISLLGDAPREQLFSLLPGNVTLASLYVHMLATTGRLPEAREAFQGLQQEAEKRGGRNAFGLHPAGGPAYDLLLAQLHAASGEYDAADKALAEGIAQARTSPEGIAHLVRLDVLPVKGSPIPLEANPRNLQRFAALALGAELLRAAQHATKLPWNTILYFPAPLHKPNRGRRPRTAEVRDFLVNYAFANLSIQADRSALRAYLALERGRTADAKTFAQEALRLSTSFRHLSAEHSAALNALRLVRLAGSKPNVIDP